VEWLQRVILVAGGTVRSVAKGLPTPIWLGKLPLNGELKSRGTPCPFCRAHLSTVYTGTTGWVAPRIHAVFRYPRLSSTIQVPLQITAANRDGAANLNFQKRPSLVQFGEAHFSNANELHRGATDCCVPMSSTASTTDGAIQLWATFIAAHVLGFVYHKFVNIRAFPLCWCSTRSTPVLTMISY
jgi:hypothetical protein